MIPIGPYSGISYGVMRGVRSAFRICDAAPRPRARRSDARLPRTSGGDGPSNFITVGENHTEGLEAVHASRRPFPPCSKREESVGGGALEFDVAMCRSWHPVVNHGNA
jgi:hypothetical protein